MKLSTILSATAIVIASGSTVLAGPVIEIGPNQVSSTLSGTNNIVFPEIRGEILQDAYQDFSIYADTEDANPELLFQGTLMTRVARTFQTGMLTFNYRLIDPNTSLSGMVSNVEVSGFENWRTGVEYRNNIAPGDEGPINASRNNSGDIINFNFGNELQTSEESRYFFVMLDATEFYEDAGLATIYLQSGESVSFSVISANPAVPAPGALGLLSAAGLISVRRRR